MSVVFWRMVNGYSYNPALNPPASTTSYFPSSYLAPTTPSPAAATPALPPSLSPTSPAATHHGALLPKLIFPEWNANQLQYMFLPKMPKAKGDKVNKAVKCEICNITLNSEVQAQQHYSGKNHLKKMKQLGMPLPGEEEAKKILKQYGRSQDGSTGSEAPASGEESQQSDSTTPPPQPNQLPPLQPQLSQQQEQQQQHQQQGEENDQKLDPVTQAVYDNIMGKLPKKRKMEIPCAVCDMIFNSEVQADQHFKGVRHAKRLKMVEDMKAGLIPNEEVTESALTDIKQVGHICTFCNVTLNSPQQLESHREGAQHKKNVEKMGKQQNSTESPELAGRQSGMFYCKVCDISVPTAVLLQKHMSTIEHQDRQSGLTSQRELLTPTTTTTTTTQPELPETITSQ